MRAPPTTPTKLPKLNECNDIAAFFPFPELSLCELLEVVAEGVAELDLEVVTLAWEPGAMVYK